MEPSSTDAPPQPVYAELHCVSNFSFLRGASRPEELIETAATLGYSAIAITDDCSMAGVVRAWTKACAINQAAAENPSPNTHKIKADKINAIKMIVGSEFKLDDGFRLVALANTFDGYRGLCTLISRARRAASKGEYELTRDMLDNADFQHCTLILVPPTFNPNTKQPATDHTGINAWFAWFTSLRQRTANITQYPHGHPLTIGYLALELHYEQHDQHHYHWLVSTAARYGLTLVACGDVHMHQRQRRALQDVVTCVRHHCTLATAGKHLFPNGERHLRHPDALRATYPASTLQTTLDIAAACTFTLDEITYQYPHEIVPPGSSPTAYLRKLTYRGLQWRWPDGAEQWIIDQIEHELELIRDMQYEQYFLTVNDIVLFARSKGILCQGRGSAANSTVCYCLGITSVDPTCTGLLFERFISRERNEPPDIDVDFEHERREEVIQYIYGKYGRDRAAIAATVSSYRKKSAIRDIGKVLGIEQEQIDALSKSLAWWDGTDVISERLQDMGFDANSPLLKRFAWLLEQLLGFPRHLSQHVGGFVIAEETLATLVPVENAAMPDRTIIQWDKDDLEELGLLKVDILALGMLTAIRKCFDLLQQHKGVTYSLATIPQDDTKTYDMICRADTMGVFQIESRAQMSMLPRLRPRNYYDLVIEVSLVRPGPIQGGMVNPYLRRRQGLEPVVYPNGELEAVLKRTLGVPVFQEQVMEIAMVAAGFSAGEADRLRRSMAAWRRVGTVAKFRDQLVGGMLKKGYDEAFAESIFNQVKGFGEYGFPESHAASFALLVYVSCWLKCHEPAVFLCAMLNSQPLGFYDPSDLTQDAKRHGVAVLPVDINLSEHDHTLVPAPHHPDTLQVRFGFRLVSGLSRQGIEHILGARQARVFDNVADLVSRSGINRGDQEALAAAGALASISSHRHQAQWDVLGVEQLPGLLAGASANEPQIQLPIPSEGEDIIADYLSTGLTLRRHPLALLRPKLSEHRIVSYERWLNTPNGRTACLAGLVKVRQRPGTASGVIFLTLEDETGQSNIIVWPAVAEQYRREVLNASMIAVLGVTQREGEVSHLIARKIEDLSWMIGELSTHSRNFH